MTNLLITGTDTDAGKTVLMTALIAYWQRYRKLESLGVMKLVQAGVGDREQYEKLFELPQSAQTIAPLYFKTPVAPPIAAEREGRIVDLTCVWQAFQELQQQREFVLVEALGGLGSPVTAELTVADIARDWRFNVVLVVPVKLGAIAQTVANVALARQTQLNLKGIILNCLHPDAEAHLEDWTPIPLIESLTQVRVLGVLPNLRDCEDLTKLAKAASNLDLEQLFPKHLCGQN
ncbi:dethiobiotin synthase [Lusitaniella coriacea]|uniref:dethiobiotin synthase n=1 Tax=Lusitaniella coriacea TaxID=1983105 RepID=UPI003CF090D9